MRTYTKRMLTQEEKKQKQVRKYNRFVEIISSMIEKNEHVLKEMCYFPEYSQCYATTVIRKAIMEAMLRHFNYPEPFPWHIVALLRPFRIKSIKTSGKIHYHVEFFPEQMLTQEEFDRIEYK